MPDHILLAVTAGIGLFIIGLSSAGLVVSNPATLYKIGNYNHHLAYSYFRRDFNSCLLGGQSIQVFLLLLYLLALSSLF